MVNQKEEQERRPDIQVVVFRLKNEEFGVDIQQVREIIRLSDISHIPEAPAFIEGVINLRGEVVPVTDLSKLFHLSSKEKYDKTARIIIAEVNHQTIGILVDEVPEILRIPQDQIKKTPDIIAKKIKKDYFTGVGRVDERLLILMDVNRIFSVEQLGELTKNKAA